MPRAAILAHWLGLGRPEVRLRAQPLMMGPTPVHLYFSASAWGRRSLSRPRVISGPCLEGNALTFVIIRRSHAPQKLFPGKCLAGCKCFHVARYRRALCGCVVLMGGCLEPLVSLRAAAIRPLVVAEVAAIELVFFDPKLSRARATPSFALVLCDTIPCLTRSGGF
jgi:hypothetical protein